MRWLYIGAFVAVVIAHDARVADADPSPSPSPSGRWYGWKIAAVDLGGAGAFALGMYAAQASRDCGCEEFGSGYLIMFGVGAYAAGGPGLHYGRDRPGAMVGSVALRAGLPAAGYLIARRRQASDRTATIAIGAGVAAAMVIDWTLLSHVHRAVPSAPVRPFVAPSASGMSAGLLGTF
jgi:hypothetical protein